MARPFEQTEEQRLAALTAAETSISEPKTSPEPKPSFTAPQIPDQITSGDLADVSAPDISTPNVPSTPIDTIPQPDIPEVKVPDLIEESLSKIERASLDLEKRGTREKAIGLQPEVVDLRRQAIELNKQIQLNKARALKAEQQASELGETESGQAAAIRRVQSDNTFKSLELAAQAEALSGNITLAKDLAGQAVDERFKEEEARLDTLAKNIKNNFDKMTAAEKKRALETLDKIDVQKAFVKTQRDELKDIQDVLIKVAATGKATNEQLAEIRNSDNAVEANQLAAPFLEKTLSIEQARELGVPLGTTISDVEGVVPPKAPKTFQSTETINGRRVRVVFDEEGNEISKTDLGEAGEISNVDLKRNFLQYLSAVEPNVKSKSELQREALQAGLNPEDDDINGGIKRVNKLGLFGKAVRFFTGE